MINKLSILFFLITNSLFCQIQNLTTIVKKSDKSIVKIFTMDENGEYISQGSGVIINEIGIGITNFHVLNGAKRAVVINNLGQRTDISLIIDYNQEKDLIKFQFDKSNFKFTPTKISTLKTQKGQNVFTLGYPSGFEIEGGSTLSTGIISGLRKINNQNFIQTTAPITHGSSGGGLFDEYGNLFGITTGTFASDAEDLHANLNKVIPVNEILTLNKNLNLSLSDFYSETSYDNTFIAAMEAYNSKDFEKSIRLFSEYLQTFPDNQFAWFRLGNSYNQIGRFTYDKQTLDNSIICLLRAIELDENYFFAHYQISNVYSYLKDYENAFKHAFIANSLEPNNAIVYTLLGYLYTYQNNNIKALEFYEKSIYLKENDQTRLEMAYTYLRLEQKDKADKNFKRCLELNPNYQECLFQYSLFLYKNNRKNEACFYLNKLYSINPNYNKQNIGNIINSKCN
jgi:tetratricopeptide (TPR) repeat protein